MKDAVLRALGVTAVLTAVLVALHLLGLGLLKLLGLGLFLGLLTVAVPWVGLRSLGDLMAWAREVLGSGEDGTFHAFAGVRLQITDDGHHVWLDGNGLQRILGRVEPDESLAARHAGHWKTLEDGTLMLRVDAVVRHLATMPGRDQPRVQRLRRYLEREVLYPAAQRQRLRR